jgi:solute carrier family 25 S-adenosylmethionine transporter 26
MFAAVLGESAGVLVRNPFELIKQNMQLGKYLTIKEAMVKIFQEKGVLGLYRGYFVTVFREIPFGLIQYPLYEFLKKRKHIKNNNNDINILNYSICGAQAGGIAAFITTPIDVVKTRIMTNHKFDIKKMIPTFKNIYVEEGLLKLFSGVHVRVLYISIGGMIFFGGNEFFKKLLNFKNN